MKKINITKKSAIITGCVVIAIALVITISIVMTKTKDPPDQETTNIEEMTTVVQKPEATTEAPTTEAITEVPTEAAAEITPQPSTTKDTTKATMQKQTTTKAPKQTTTVKPTNPPATNPPQPQANNCPYPMYTWTTYNGKEGYFKGTNYPVDAGVNIYKEHIFPLVETGEYRTGSYIVGTYDDAGSVTFVFAEKK